MELQEILSVAIGTLVVIVIAHFAVFWVVRTLYPPPVVYMQQPPQPQPQPQQVFTPPAVIQEPIQNVTIPTYATPVPVEAPSQEGERRGPPPPEDTSIRGKPGVATPNAQ